MARQPRFVLPGFPQHVIQRGNNRSVIFVVDADYHFYLALLAEAAGRYCCDIHAYVLMTNHVHLLVTPWQECSISKLMQSVGRRYVQYFNRRYRRTGTLWEGRYKASIVDSDRYLFTCYRYIELNPVRAGMVADPSLYRWSSHRCNGLGEFDGVVSAHGLYEALGATPEARHNNYRKLFAGQIAAEELSRLREVTNKCWAMGDSRFQQEIESLTQRQPAPKPRGGSRKLIEEH